MPLDPERPDSPLRSPVAYPESLFEFSSGMESGMDSGMETPTLASDAEHVEDRQQTPSADADTSIAGITFETSHGRFVCLYWQSTTGVIWQSKFLLIERPFVWKLSSTVCVASDSAKQRTPLAATSWANGLKQWVFFLDELNLVRERISTDYGKTWSDGTLNDLAIGAAPESKLSVNLDSFLQDNITYKVNLWYHDAKYEIRQLRFVHDPLEMIASAEKLRGRWTPGPRLKALPLRRSFLTSSVDYNGGWEWVHYLLPSKKIGYSNWPTDITQTGDVSSSEENQFNGPFDSSTTASICHSSLSPAITNLYINSGVRERVVHHKWTQGTGWEGPFPLYESEPVRQNFVALQWNTDDDTLINLFWLETAATGIRAYDVVRGISPAAMALA
ncbi:hypothetical protein BDZ91DRAFT_712963 [Kalaharituber pfeilii]|nr:hypothetical protein BDZ91DRAFT_712963 [Kalaharituber pfeilii]